jgi:hypothetical protein
MVIGPGDAATDFYFEKFGPGILVGKSEEFGHVYVPLPQELERLEFVSRRSAE